MEIAHRSSHFQSFVRRNNWMQLFGVGSTSLVSDWPRAALKIWHFARKHQSQRLDFPLWILDDFYHWNETSVTIYPFHSGIKTNLKWFCPLLPNAVLNFSVFETLRFYDWIHAFATQCSFMIFLIFREYRMSHRHEAQVQIAICEHVDFRLLCGHCVHKFAHQWCFMYVFWCKCHLCAATAEVQCSNGAPTTQSSQ